MQDDNLKILTNNFGKSDWKTVASFLPVSTDIGVMLNRLCKRFTVDFLRFKYFSFTGRGERNCSVCSAGICTWIPLF